VRDVTLHDARCEWQLDRKRPAATRSKKRASLDWGRPHRYWMWLVVGNGSTGSNLASWNVWVSFSQVYTKESLSERLRTHFCRFDNPVGPPMKAKTGSGVLVSLTTQRRTRPAQHKCDLCPSDFTTKHNLRSNISLAYHRRFGSRPRSDHMKSHYAIRDYRCEGSP
jgi:hypothetical protein